MTVLRVLIKQAMRRMKSLKKAMDTKTSNLVKKFCSQLTEEDADKADPNWASLEEDANFNGEKEDDQESKVR